MKYMPLNQPEKICWRSSKCKDKYT